MPRGMDIMGWGEARVSASITLPHLLLKGPFIKLTEST